MEVLGKLAYQAIANGDECVGVMSSKIAEYKKKKYFPANMKFISKIDWCIENYKDPGHPLGHAPKKEFGGLSWREAFFGFARLDRPNFDYDSSLEVTSQVYQFFEFIFEKEKPDMIISEPPADLFNGVAYYFCRLNKTPYFGLMSSRFEDRIDIYDLETTCSKYEKTFREINNNNISDKEKQFAKNFVEEFISHKKLPSYLGSEKIYFTQFGFIKHYLQRIKELGRPHFQYFLNRKHFKKFDFESENIFKDGFWAPLKAERRKFRIFSQKNIFNCSNQLDNNQKFFLFPLQIQPEASTFVLATYFCDQLNTIKNIALTLPLPYKLYVKQHPHAVGTKPISFYKKLKEIPNVVLISPHENTENLIKKSAGVITLTSTLGMEAALIGRPVYVLGNIFYSYHPLCRKVKNFEELKDRIAVDLINKPNVDNLEDINQRFIISYFKNTIPGTITEAVLENDTNNYELIYKYICQK